MKKKESTPVQETRRVLGDEEKRVYECAFHLVPTLDESGRSAAVEGIRKHVEVNGTILNERFPELFELAFPMSREVLGVHRWFDTSYFGWMYVEAPPEAMTELHGTLSRDEHIIRFLIIRTTKEHALAGHRYSFARDAAPRRESEEVPMTEAQKEAGPLSEADVDKAIEELVSEPEEVK